MGDLLRSLQGVPLAILSTLATAGDEGEAPALLVPSPKTLQVLVESELLSLLHEASKDKQTSERLKKSVRNMVFQSVVL